MSDDTQEDDHHDENLTTSYRERWEYIGTLLAGLLVTSLPILIVGAAAGVLTFNPIGQAWFTLYATIVLMAATWAFGKQTLEAVKAARK